jgi:hypothetical protein
MRIGELWVLGPHFSLETVGYLKPDMLGLNQEGPDIVWVSEPIFKVPWNPWRAQNNSHE